MIQSYAGQETRTLYLAANSRRWPDIARTAARRLAALDFASAFEDLRNPPGNHLEKLKGDREGQWRIRINDRLRVCFRWDGKDAWDVEIVDYHQGEGR